MAQKSQQQAQQDPTPKPPDMGKANPQNKGQNKPQELPDDLPGRDDEDVADPKTSKADQGDDQDAGGDIE